MQRHFTVSCRRSRRSRAKAHDVPVRRRPPALGGFTLIELLGAGRRTEASTAIPGFHSSAGISPIWYDHPVEGMTAYQDLDGIDSASPAATPITLDFVWSYASDGSPETPGRGNHDAAGGTLPSATPPGQNNGYLDGHVRWVSLGQMRPAWRNHEGVYAFW